MPVGLVTKGKTTRRVADKINSKLLKIKKLRKKKSDRDRLTENTIKLKGGTKRLEIRKILKRKQNQHKAHKR